MSAKLYLNNNVWTGGGGIVAFGLVFFFQLWDIFKERDSARVVVILNNCVSVW